MRLTRPVTALLLLMCVSGCASRKSGGAARAPFEDRATRDARLSMPAFGLSVPTPHGWVQDLERIGSIGTVSLATWMRSGASAASTTEPAAPEASIVLFLANPKAFKELPGGARAEPGPVVDGTPSLRLIRAQPTTGQAREGRPASVDERLVEGYRLEAHGFHYYLLLISAQPHEPDLAALRAMVAGWRWLAPGPAHEALTPSGQLTRVAHDADLWFDIPQPFVNNPFRGEYYVAFSVVEKKSAAGAHFEVDELVGARDAAAARQAARDTPDYYETHGWDFAWRQTSSDPEVHVGGTTPTPPDREGTIWHQAAVVARSREGRYFRILFTTHGRDPGVMKAYAAIVEDVARSVTTTPPPDEPLRRRGGSG